MAVSYEPLTGSGFHHYLANYKLNIGDNIMDLASQAKDETEAVQILLGTVIMCSLQFQRGGNEHITNFIGRY